MSVMIEYGGIVGLLVLVVLIAMAAVAVQGLIQSLMRGGIALPGASGSGGGGGQGELFGREEFEAVYLHAGNKKGFGLRQLADLVEQMNVEARLAGSGLYIASQDEKPLFYIANGFAQGRLDALDGNTERLVFILPLGSVETPTRSFEVMMRAAVTVLKEFGGTLRDSSRELLSAQGIEHLRERVRSWEMRERRSPATQ